MSPIHRVMLSVTLGLAAFTLAACAGGGLPAPGSMQSATQSEQRQMSLQTASAAGEQLFVSAANRPGPGGGIFNEIDVYQVTPPYNLVRKIRAGVSGPNGMAVNAAGDLFVANVDNDTVEEFGPHTDTPIRVITTSFHNPLTLAVGSNGTLYAVNYLQIGHGSSIFEFRPGNTIPAVTIHLPGGFEGLALDDHNNLYAGYNTVTGVGRILRFAPGSAVGKELGIKLRFAGGVAIDNRGNLLACDQTGHVIDVFAPGQTTPMKQISQGLTSPYQMTFSPDFTRLFVADNVSHTVNVYSYPDGMLVNQIQRANAASGVAVDPPATP